MANDQYYLEQLENATVYDQTGDKIGSVGQVYLDDQTGEPKFVTVNTGFFGTNETFVPLQGATQNGEDLTVPYEKDFVKDAPNIDVDQHLSPAEEDELFAYYNLTSAGTPLAGTAAAGTAAGTVDGDREAVAGEYDASREGVAADYDATREGVAADAEGGVVAHEERLRVGTEQVETGRARLRKHVRTETEQVEVPVRREELVIEREAIDPNSPEAVGGTIGQESDEVITLREERPVVATETVATERVNVGTRTVEDTETVSGEVRKETIEVEQDGNLVEGDLRDGDVRPEDRV